MLYNSSLYCLSQYNYPILMYNTHNANNIINHNMVDWLNKQIVYVTSLLL